MMRSLLHSLDTKGGFGFAVLVLVLTAAVFAPLLAPLDPNVQDIMNPARPPAWAAGGSTDHLLGTDQLGRDVLSRIIFGTRVSLITAFAAVSGSAVIGIVLGIIAGYTGGWTAVVIMRLVDIVLAVPFILLALVFMTVSEPSIFNVVVAFVAARWVQYTRIIYGLVLELREREFIQACVASGLSTLDILFRHILINVAGPVLVVATLELGFVILIESGLSFLGLGTPPEIPSWGSMLQEGRSLINIAWWMTTFPGMAIMITVVGFNFVGDWLRDQIDPRTHSRSSAVASSNG